MEVMGRVLCDERVMKDEPHSSEPRLTGDPWAYPRVIHGWLTGSGGVNSRKWGSRESKLTI